jgi:speckle-type POZ protein
MAYMAMFATPCRLVAADRFGLGRLKVMSENRLSLSIGIETLASTFALVEQFNCSHLKAKCVAFICGGSSKTRDAILATEGYRHLDMSSAPLLTELVQAAHISKRSRSTADVLLEYK